MSGLGFTELVLGVSGLAALSVALIADGTERGTVALELIGALVGVLAVLGIVALARIVVLSERARRRG